MNIVSPLHVKAVLNTVASTFPQSHAFYMTLLKSSNIQAPFATLDIKYFVVLAVSLSKKFYDLGCLHVIRYSCIYRERVK